jgi:hypothetical protein
VREGLNPRPDEPRRNFRQVLVTARLVLVLLALCVLAWMTMAEVNSADTGM